MNNLTKRELDIINLITKGKTNGEIAKQLYISVHTVKKNLESIYEKTKCVNRVQLVVKLLQENIVKMPE